MQVGGIGNEGRNGNSGLDNRGVSHQSINYRIDDSAQDARRQDTAGRDVAEKTTSAYTVSFSSEGKRLAAEYAAGRAAEKQSLDRGRQKDAEQEMSPETARQTGYGIQGAGTQSSGGILGTLRGLLESGKRLLLQIWGESKAEEAAEAPGGAGDQALSDGAESTGLEEDLSEQAVDLAGMDGDEHHEAPIAAAATNVQAPAGMTANDPYFNNTSDAGKVSEPLLVRIRIRFRDILGQFAERFGGMLSGQFSAESGLKDRQEQKDNLPAEQKLKNEQARQKKQYYQKNGVVVDISTPVAEHLMDSYDKAGEYSKLTTEQKPF